MDPVQIDELKSSYYEYIANVPQGLQIIANLLTNNEIAKAIENIVNLAEGLEFLLQIEQVLLKEGLVINSQINEANFIFNEMNESLINNDYILLKDLIEYELITLFSSASEWTFSNKEN